jgi:tetratricopeptide (TPR) repeat protein
VDRYYARLLKQAETDEQKLGVKLAFVNVLEETDPALAFGFLRDDIAQDPAYKGHPAVLSKLAQENAQRNNWSRAAELVQQYLETVETPADSYRRLHVLYRIKAGQFDRARQLLEQLPDETVGQKAFIAQQRAQILEQQAATKLGQQYQDLLDQAEEMYTRAISLDPQNSRSLVLRARFYSRTGQMVKAIRDARAAEQLTDASEIQLLLAELLADSGQSSRAESIYRQVLNSNPSQQVYGQLLSLYMNDEDWRRLEQTVAECKKLYPRDPGYDLLLAQSYEIRSGQARNADEARQLARARLQALQSARQTDPDSPAAAVALAQALLDNRMYDQLLRYVRSAPDSQPQLAGNLKLYRGLALAGKGQTEAAEAVFNEFITSAGPRQLQAGVSRIRRSYGRDAEAFLAAAADWVEKRPDDPVLLTTIAGAIVTSPGGKEHSRQAKTYLETALANTQDANLRASAQAILGQTWYNLGEYTKSRDAYLAALKVQPDNITALNNLAYVYAENLDDPTRALPFARRAARLEPENASILDTYAWTLARTGRYEEALAPMERAVRLAGEGSAGLLEYHLGYIHEQLGHLRSAERAYDSALQRQSADAETRQNIQQGLQRVRAELKRQEEQG